MQNAAFTGSYEVDNTTYSFGLTARVHVPGNRVAYSGDNTVVDAYHDPLLQSNVVRFSVNELAESAIVTRTDSSGEVGIAGEVEGPILPGFVYEIVDGSFDPGSNYYAVRTGIGVNGWSGEMVEVQN